MKKVWLGVLGLLTCTVVTISADGFKDSDALLAGKDFPFPPDESDLPENTLLDDDGIESSDSGYATPINPQRTRPERNIDPESTPSPIAPQKNRSEKPMEPEVNKPRAGKDIFPPDTD